MAGIGFALRRMARQDALSANLGGFGYAVLVSSGPWLLTCLALAGIEWIGHDVLAQESRQRFSVIVTYNFSFSLVISAPVVLVATRCVADALFSRDLSRIPGMVVGALALIFGLLGVAGGAFYGLAVEMSTAERMVALIGLLLTGGIWLLAACMSALKSYATIASAFAGGMGLALTLSMLLAGRFGGTGALSCFTLGLAVTFFVLAARVFAEYPGTLERPFAFLRDFRRYRLLAAAGLVYNAGIWVDKWIMWAAPGHVLIPAGMITHPAYESAMFLAYLTIVPAMALFLVEVETRFYEAYVRFYRDIEQHGTMEEIRANHAELVRVLGRGIRSIAVVQLACCLMGILAAPAIVRATGGGIEMVPIFRFGVLGSLFHVLLVLMLSVLAYFDLRQALLKTAAVFLTLNAALTFASLGLSPEYQGYGYFMACLLSFAFALHTVVVHLERLPYLTFVGNNPALRPAR
ncbi:exopolysaccharide Pel transporter PelG [Caldimonas tepidiphila]|uniref:exopolysaccharide Pel transporter PelG n=1 Tax=Caldimonas tepidiphila TaxID=2315841 RepID=UPI000E5C29C2|nr:exopolysaccharide Pel transporter PelG [Caldimonas tepidiphila]